MKYKGIVKEKKGNVGNTDRGIAEEDRIAVTEEGAENAA
jgi:hypothetical protein